MSETSKRCTQCGIIKSLDLLYNEPRFRSGKKSECKECFKLRNRNYGPGKRRVQHLMWERANPEKVHARHARYWYANKDKLLATKKAWRAKNKNKVRAYLAIQYALSKGHITKPSCCHVCGAVRAIHAHHSDYSKPLEVTWLCEQCHGRLHKGTLEAVCQQLQM